MWFSAHFAVGMACGAAMAAPLIVFKPRWWPAVQPIAMTLGGIWACIPDAPRLWREDFTRLPLGSLLGTKDLENWLHSIGDVFFFHASMDAYRNAHGTEFALAGMAGMIALYSFAILVLMARAYLVPPHRAAQPPAAQPEQPPMKRAA